MGGPVLRGVFSCLLGALALLFPQAAAQAGAGTPPARFQFEALDLVVPAGQTPDGPETFEAHRARALDQFRRTASLTQQRTEAAAKREAALRALRGADAGQMLLDMISGQASRLLSQANPIAGMVFDMVVSQVRQAQASGAQRARSEAYLAEQALADEEAHRPRLRRISVWDGWLRVDDLDDGSAIIHKPDVGEYLVLDTFNKTWVRLDSAPELYPDTAWVAGDPQRCTAVPDRAATPLGPRRIDGQDARGYREIERVSTGNGVTMVLDSTYFLGQQAIPPAILALLNGMPPCPDDSPVARAMVVPDGYVTPYQSMVVRWEGLAAPGMADQGGEEGMLGFEQRLRGLGEQDKRDLFAPPADYRRLD